MSWRLVKEVRDGRRDKPGDLTKTEFFVLMLIADACHKASRRVSMSMAEMETLTGYERTAIWRAVCGLERKGYLARVSRGNQFSGASIYEVLERSARCANATSTHEVLVAKIGVLVAETGSARCASATVPDTEGTEGDARAGADARVREAPTNPPPPCSKHPNGNPDDDDCGGCALARKRRQAWDEQRAQAHADALARRRQALVDCKLCDEYGWRLGADLSPVEPARICDHQATAIAEAPS